MVGHVVGQVMFPWKDVFEVGILWIRPMVSRSYSGRFRGFKDKEQQDIYILFKRHVDTVAL